MVFSASWSTLIESADRSFVVIYLSHCLSEAKPIVTDPNQYCGHDAWFGVVVAVDKRTPDFRMYMLDTTVA